jgi:hypothetical protein
MERHQVQQRSIEMMVLPFHNLLTKFKIHLPKGRIQDNMGEKKPTAESTHSGMSKSSDGKELEKLIEYVHHVQFERHHGEEGRDYRNPQNLDWGDCLKKKTYRHAEQDIFVECLNIQIPHCRMTPTQPFRSLGTNKVVSKQNVSTQKALMLYEEDLFACDVLELRTLAEQPVEFEDMWASQKKAHKQLVPWNWPLRRTTRSLRQ